MIFGVINMHGNVEEKPVNYCFNFVCAGLWKEFSYAHPLLLFSRLFHTRLRSLGVNALPCEFGSCKSLGLKCAIAICKRWDNPQLRIGPYQAK